MIDVSSLVFTYPSQNAPTLKGLDFQMAEGEIFGFLGPSGSGKSTTQKILMGLLTGYEGSINILGKDGKEWGTELYHQIGVGFELPNHFSNLTGLENLQLYRSFYGSKRDPMELLEMVGLTDAADQRTKNYSKGMKMRLNFVRAILHDPTLLFLDEPTAGLDPVNARKLKDIILDLKRAGKTIFLTTHHMHDADELCDRIALIDEGEIKLMDTPRNLKLQHGENKVLVEHETAGELQRSEFSLQGLHENAEFMSILQSGTIETIHSREATLEDVFIQTTGRGLQ